MEIDQNDGAAGESAADVDMDVEDSGPAIDHHQSAPAEEYSSRALPRRHPRRRVPIQGALASKIVEETNAALAQNAPQPGPVFPKRNWACPHRDYFAIHRGGPFNCADCAFVQSEYILQCKLCKIHLCVRCADLYEDRDWWVDGPPRGRQKPGRSQVVRDE